LPAALLLAAPAPAHAMLCMSLGSGGLVIGQYQPLQAVPLDAQTSLAIECLPATPGEALNLEVRILNAGTSRVQLPNVQAATQGSSMLVVQLYRDAARTLPMDEQTTIRISDRPLMPTRYWISLYARVPARQDAGTGQYRLPLTLLISY
jgi:spore coat protein U-like protein